MSKIYQKMQDEHAEYIQENFPNLPCNFGWVQDGDGMCSKIYGRGIVTSEINKSKIIHSFREF